MYSMYGGGYRYPQGASSTATYNTYYDSNRTAQNRSSNPSSYYVARRSTNSLPFTQQYAVSYPECTASGIGHSAPVRRVNPALTVNSNQLPPSQYPSYQKQNYFFRRNTRSEIDDSPIIDPRAFQYLNLNERKPKKKVEPNEIESGIDSRSIISLDAVKQLERRRQQQLEKSNRSRGDDGPTGGIDDRSVIDSNAFRYIEAKLNKNEKQGQGTASGIDDRPIVNPNAFKYLEMRHQQKSTKPVNEPSIDTRPIVNPNAFKFIEKQEIPSQRTFESGVDSNPIVDPNVFRYLERHGFPPDRNVQSGVDSTPIINPIAFKYIEKRPPSKLEPAESSIDSRPIISPEAFKWIELKETRRLVDDGPDIDERSYVNPQGFRYIDQHMRKRNEIPTPEIDTCSYIFDRNQNALAHLELRFTKRKTDIENGVDERSYVNPNAFKYIEGTGRNSKKQSTYSSIGPLIDTTSYVDTESFRHLEGAPRKTQQNDYEDRDHIDERPFIPPSAFRHLEFTDQHTHPHGFDHPIYGQTDV